MWRSLFFAIGAMLVIVGLECLLIDSATLTSKKPEVVQVSNASWFQQTSSAMTTSPKRIVRPPEWIPWSLIAGGAVVILYAMTLPQRWGKKG